METYDAHKSTTEVRQASRRLDNFWVLIISGLGIIAIFRLGSHVPVPGVSYPAVQECIKNAPTTTGVLGLANLFSGGALLQLSIFALGIMPYITASIIVQLLTVVIPRFEALKKEGQQGQTKMTQYTRYLTIGLAILQSSTLITFAQNPTEIEVAHEERFAGQSKYSLYSLIRLNFDLVTGFSVVPLQWLSFIGVILSLGSAGLFVLLLVRRFIVGAEVQGVFTLFAITFFLLGVIVFALGLLGEYVGRIYQQVRARPRYLIQAVLEQHEGVPAVPVGGYRTGPTQ